MIRLYLIRHGETEWNKARRFQGWTDIELSSEGEEQASLLGQRFKKIKVDEIYASPLKRAVATAMPIANVHGIKVITKEHFKEINFGEWEGMTAPEISAKYGKDFDDFMIAPEKGIFPGDYSFDKVTDRIKIGLEEVLEEKADKNIVIVSHGGIIRLMIKYLMEFDCEWYNKTWIDNTAISLIEIRKYGKLMRVLNDSSHLDNGIL
ncbi:MAG: histidine phosphatase family protein [Lachnospiraceae bacterium]|nr:histidine phosphatase family protein [Lachnospiraceae bacterium]